jgi:hypothetical protein
MKLVLPTLCALALLPFGLVGCGGYEVDTHTYYLSHGDRVPTYYAARRGSYRAHGYSHRPARVESRRAPERRERVSTLPKPAARSGRPVQPGSAVSHDGKYPVAKKVPFKEGYVYSPFTKQKINVSKVPSGAKVLDPSSEHVFIKP